MYWTEKITNETTLYNFLAGFFPETKLKISTLKYNHRTEFSTEITVAKELLHLLFY